MTVSRHTYSALWGQYRVPIEGGTLSLNEGWSPYIQGTIRVPLQPRGILDAADPRTGARVRLRFRKAYGSSLPASVLDEAFPGTTAADLTAEFAGMTARELTARFGRPFNSFGDRPSSIRTFNLGARVRSVNHLTGMVDLTVESDEALLWDYNLVQTTSLIPAPATVRAAVTMVLTLIGATLQAGVDDGPIEADAVAWEPGTSAWDYLQPLVNAAGLRLWCDEQRRWRLTKPLAPVEGGLFLDTSTLEQADDEVSRNDAWYDAVIVTYRWRDSAGVDHVRHDIAGEASYTRSLAVQYDRPWPGDGAAEALLTRAQARGHLMSGTLVSDYGVTPGQVLSLTLPSTPIQAGMLSRVTWNLDGDSMTIISRDLVDTPATAWVLAPADVAWEDLPAGMSWPEYDPNLIG